MCKMPPVRAQNRPQAASHTQNTVYRIGKIACRPSMKHRFAGGNGRKHYSAGVLRLVWCSHYSTLRFLAQKYAVASPLGGRIIVLALVYKYIQKSKMWVDPGAVAPGSTHILLFCIFFLLLCFYVLVVKPLTHKNRGLYRFMR